MELKWIQSLVRLMTKAELTELEIEDHNAGMRVHLRRGPEDAGGAPLVNVLQGGGQQAAPVMAPAPAAAPPAAAAAEAPAAPSGDAFLSPMVGTFYRSASPDSDPFVAVGSRVEEDTVLCIVEAMKVMNEIKAETTGEIVEILVENGDPVEFGQPLFTIKRN